MTYQFRNERGVMKIYNTRKRLLYWLDRPQGVIDIVALLNEKAAQQGVQSDVLPCGHDPNNLRLGDDGIYGCAECLATRR